MIYFFDKNLELIECKNELSFSFSKKANREGGGKIEVEELPNRDSLYIAIYNTDSPYQKPTEEKNYIASGFISEIEKREKNVSISFNTFEGLLKDNKLPKTFSNFEGQPLITVFLNLFYSFVPIIKSKKKDFSNITDGYGSNAFFTQGVLKSDGIVFSKIKDGDLHLAFQSSSQSSGSQPIVDNSYRYKEKGSIIFWFKLGVPCCADYYLNGETPQFEKEKLERPYAKRYLRFTASLGAKTIINVKAIGNQEPFKTDSSSIKAYEEEFKSAKNLEFDRSVKDFEKNIGVELPIYTQYIAIQFTFIYEKPDWIQDFSTQEVYTDKGELQRRTVRGFTPVLHGFEILDRRPIAPFSGAGLSSKVRIHFYDVDVKKPESIVKKTFSSSQTKIKFDGLSLYEALTKFLDTTKLNLEIALSFDEKLKNSLDIKVSQYNFNAERIKKNVVEYIDEEHILRLQEGQASRLNNYILKAIRNKTQRQKILHCYGEGDGQDVLYTCLFSDTVKKADGSLSEVLKLYSPVKVEENSTIGNTLTSLKINQVQELPDYSFAEERIEDSTIKDLKSLIVKAQEHFLEAKKKENYNFEIDSTQDIRLYDTVLLIYQQSNLQLKANIEEIKINSKASKLQKTYGIGGFLFNPFNCFFQKPQIEEVKRTPLTPFNIRAFTQAKHLKIFWDCLGVNDGYVIEVSRLDGKNFSESRNQEKAFFYSTNTEIDLSLFDLKTLYKLCIYSYIENIKSAPSIFIYFKVFESLQPIRILQSLAETGSEEGELGFYLDINYRNATATLKELCRFLGWSSTKELETLNQANDKSDNCFSNFLANGLDVEKEALYQFLGQEYVWKDNEWVDVRFRLPRHNPIVYFNFKKENITEDYPEEIAEALREYFYILNDYENARQLLAYLSTHLQLPPKNNNGNPIRYPSNVRHKFSSKSARGSGYAGIWKPPTLPPSPPPIFEPITPPFNPPKPPPPPQDHRLKPSLKEIELWDETLKKCEVAKKKLKSHYINVRKTNGTLFDQSFFRHNLNFNIPLFSLYKNEFTKKEVVGNRGAYLDGAFRFTWQSTVADGEFAWRYETPFFRINTFKKNAFYNSGAEEHTLSFYLSVKKLEGEFELWNIKNYNIGRIVDGVLSFGLKDDRGVFYVFYQKKLIDRTPNSQIQTIKLRNYIHIMVVARKAQVYVWQQGNSISVTQKIYIDFEEVPPEEYKHKKRTINLEKDIATSGIDFSLFNFNVLKKTKENYYPYTSRFEPIYKKSTFFDVCLSHLLLFGYALDYGEREFIKKYISYPIKNLKKEPKKNNYNAVLGNVTPNSKYKGVCVSSVDSSKNAVDIYERGIVEFNVDDFFLMGQNDGTFKAGILYSWTGSFWQGLTPYSLYHKEYLTAYRDIAKMQGLLPNIFVKDFIINNFLISDIFYSQDMQANSLTVQESFFINDIKDRDPKIKGQVYQQNGQLFISQG